jgi:hypothetical protein
MIGRYPKTLVLQGSFFIKWGKLLRSRMAPSTPRQQAHRPSLQWGQFPE